MVLLVVMILNAAAFVQASDTVAVPPGCPGDSRTLALLNKAVSAANDGYTQTVEDHGGRLAALSREAKRLADCIGKYKNINISSALGVPDIMGMLGGAMSGLANMVCNEVDNAFDRATAPARKEIVLPGGLGKAGVGLPSSSQIKNSGSTTVNKISVPGGTVEIQKTTPTILRDAEHAAKDKVLGAIYQ